MEVIWLRWQMADSAFFCIMKLYARFNGEWDPRRGGYRNISLDLAGKPRIITETVDMGCFEYDPPPLKGTVVSIQ